MTSHEISEIPQSLISILKSCQSEDRELHHFPPTEIFNEGWMLRLVLDALENLEKSVGVADTHPLKFCKGAKWYSEARLSSPFLRKPKKDLPSKGKDTLGEGYTNADGVIGHFTFREGTKAGLKLNKKGEGTRQFIVVEAKMNSNLSSGTTNAPGYNQAARNVACMAETIRLSGTSLDDLKSVGFFVVTAKQDTKLADCLKPKSIRDAVNERINSYESASRKEARDLSEWKTQYFLPLVDRLENEKRLSVLTWKQIIDPIADIDQAKGNELRQFYEYCLKYA